MKTNEFNALYNKHKASLLKYVGMRVLENGVAEEIVDDTFLKLYEHLNVYDKDKANISTWLHHIATNKITDYLRTKKLETVSIDTTVDENGREKFQFSGGLNSNHDIEEHELTAAIEHAMSGLTGLHKDVAELFFYEEKEYAEIAEMLNISLGTVKGTLSRARVKLQEKLALTYINTF
jgi:RNA polymerase sigma-70 factor, ECF subfamily